MLDQPYKVWVVDFRQLGYVPTKETGVFGIDVIKGTLTGIGTEIVFVPYSIQYVLKTSGQAFVQLLHIQRLIVNRNRTNTVRY